MKRIICCTLLSLIMPWGAFAANTGNKALVYTGRVLKPNGAPLEASNVQFTIGIYSPGSEDCRLYEEVQNINMQGSKGAFSLNIGEGTRTGGFLATDMETVFRNDSEFTSLSCASGTTFDPTVSLDKTERILKVSFNDGSGAVTLAPQKIKGVPYSLHSLYSVRAKDVTGTANLFSLIVRNTFNNQINIAAPLSFANYSLVLPVDAGGPGDLLRTDGSGNLSWVAAGSLGGGTVTSVGVTVPSYMNASAPVTTAGNITLGFNSQAANTVFAAPSGTAGAPSFRTLTASDIPDLSATYLRPADVVATAPLSWDAGTKTMAIDTSGLQARVSGTCAAGSSIRTINVDGTVVCEADDSGLGAETDPEVGANTLNYVPKWDGTALVSGNIFDNGNVGIGTATPGHTLDLNGATGLVNLGITSNDNVSDVNFHSYFWGTAGSSIRSYRAKGTSAAPLTVAGNDQLLNIRGFGYDGSDFVESARINLKVDTTPTGPGDMPGKISFVTKDASGTLAERMTIKSSGNVGIGTANPSGILDIHATTPVLYQRAGSNSAHILLRSAGGTVAAPTARLSGQELGQISFGGHTGSAYLSNDTGIVATAAEDWSGASNSGSNLLFKTKGIGQAGNAQNRMVIDSLGNVGIGVGTPDSRLEVGGTVTINTAGAYLNYKPNAVECNNDEILKWNATDDRWVCGTEAGAGGLVTSITVSAPLSQNGTTGAVTMDFDYATGNFEINGSQQLAIKTDGVGAAELASTSVTAGSYGSTTEVATFTVDADGRLTAAGSVPLALSPTVITDAAKANHVAIYDGSGVLSSEVSLAVSRGGTGNTTFTGNHIVATNATGNQMVPFTCSVGQIIKFDASGYAACGDDIGVVSEVDPKIGANTLNYVSKWDGSALVTGSIFDDGTNVGIGTSTPGGKLHVSGGSILLDNSYGIRAKDSGGTASSILEVTSGNNVQLFNRYAAGNVQLGTSNATNPGNVSFSTQGSQRMTITSGGNVGIGTSSPTADLAIDRGASTASFDVIGNAAEVYLRRDSYADGVAGLILRVGSSNQHELKTLSAVPLVLGTNNTERMRIDGSGSVGIGTASPTAKLDVVDADGGVTGRLEGANAAWLQFNEVDSTKVWNLIVDGGNFDFREDGTSNARLRIRPGGNIGIGTNINANSILDIEGALTVRGLASAPANAPSDQARFYYDTVTDKMMMSVNNTGYQELATVSGVSTAYVAKIGDTMTGPLVNNSNSATAAVAVTQSGAGNAATFMGGKVGIGTINPGAELHVASNGNTVLRVQNSGSATSYFDFNDVSAASGRITKTRGTGAVLLDIDAVPTDGVSNSNVRMFANTNTSASRNFQIFSGDSSPTIVHQFNGASNGSSYLAASGGKVGIGTTSPTYLTHIRTSAEGGDLLAIDADARVGVKLGVEAPGTNHQFGTLKFEGSTNISADRSIAGKIYGNSLNDINQANNGVLQFEAQVNGGTVTTANTYSFNNNGVSQMTISPAGHIGIGNTSPTYKLDVTGDINSTTRLRIAGTEICTVSGCTSSSDERLKENIQPLSGSLEKILSIQGVEYDWKDKERFGEQHQIGLIAQELEKVYPEVVKTDGETGYKSVLYGHLVAPMIESIKTLYKKLVSVEREITSVGAGKADKSEVAALRAENAEKSRKIKELEQRLERLEKALNAK